MKKRFFNILLFGLHIVLPLSLGGAIYVLLRTDNLTMFKWFESLGFYGFIESIRSSHPIKNAAYPYWFVFCLPNALWIYSLTAYLLILWKNAKGRYLWFAAGPIIGVVSEIAQINGLFPGTFDGIDLAFTAVFSAVPFITLNPFRKERRAHEQQ
ncbi:hypothetical protein JXL83_05255 [candidate division WOR-3 bacterium]|nr:hypothetical protein [candidate division WOR-3 bacterium]